MQFKGTEFNFEPDFGLFGPNFVPPSKKKKKKKIADLTSSRC